jgi:hypothetical protein
MKYQFVAGLVSICFATVTFADPRYKDNVDACNSAFLADVTSVEGDAVVVKMKPPATKRFAL